MTLRVLCVGPVIVDVLARPCAELPPGQLGQRVEQIRITAAGTGAGTAVDFAKLGAQVRLAGCVGTDELAEFVLGRLAHHGVDTTAVQRSPAAQTSASVLPVRADGERPAYHVVGANAHLDLARLDLDALLAGCEHLHVGGPESMGGFAATGLAALLRAAKARGATTSLDLLAARVPARLVPVLRAALADVDYLLPNEEQLCALYGLDLAAAAAAARADGARVVAATRGAAGAYVLADGVAETVPGFEVAVLDTTGCGDAFSAAFVVAAAQGRSPVQAARLGCAAGALTATGLGSDAGISDLASVEALAARASR